jgi:MSHA pilin protein MshA
MRIEIHKSHSGFTLIELIVVIVILGILSATALPKFINVAKDARIAELTALSGSIKSASNLVYAKAVIKGINDQTGLSIDIDDDGVDDFKIHYGYPNSGDEFSLRKTVNLEDYSLSLTGYGTPTPVLHIANKNVASNIDVQASNCYLSYARSISAGALPTITLITSGC